MKKSAVICGMLVLQACVSPVERNPQDDAIVSPAYSRTASGREHQMAVWWHAFDNAALNALVQEALDNNPGIGQKRLKLTQAQALARQSRAGRLPELDISGNARQDDGDETYGLSSAASYEVDVWGKYRARHRASRLEARATAEDLRAAEITLISAVTEYWLRLLSLREEESLLSRQVEINETVTELQHKRYASGMAGALDVLQQREVLERAKAQLPDVQADREVILQQLAVVTGKSPSDIPQIAGGALPDFPALPDTGLPAALLENRPDVKAAWLRVQSADWAAEAAWANRLPDISLSVSEATEAATLGGLFDTWVLSALGAVAAPVFDGGSRRAEELRQRAIADERMLAYKEVVLNAMAEVENALSRSYHQQRKIDAIRLQIAASRSALKQAQVSYINGEETYLSVLNSLLNVQSLERQFVVARRDLALYQLALVRALGGSRWWKREGETGAATIAEK